MSKRYKIGVLILFGLGVVVAGWLQLRGRDIAVLSPEGTIGLQQRNLLLFASALGLLVVVPVFILTSIIVWRYRESNKKATYRPTWDGHKGLEILWWGIPCALITVLGVVAWQSSHTLDPYKPLASTTKPLKVQVIALPWKWLFIYPEQHIATVNYLQFPEDTPLNLEITADAPMNSFWIPKLGGQVYAMSGMTTKLHLMANNIGSYQGSSANLSGKGFAGMHFTAEASRKDDFDAWVRTQQKGSSTLSESSYAQLALPSENNPPANYTLTATNLYDTVVMKYMMPGHDLAPQPLTTNKEQAVPQHY
jgi:cytochrome o ubiquinol oxidase subunit 2